MAETSANDDESKEIKLDAVMAEENDSTEEKEKAKKSDAKQEIKVADVKSEVAIIQSPLNIAFKIKTKFSFDLLRKNRKDS